MESPVKDPVGREVRKHTSQKCTGATQSTHLSRPRSYPLYFLSSLCACVCKCIYTWAHKHGGQRTTCRLFFPFYPVGSREGIQSSCLAAKGFPCRVISLAHSLYPVSLPQKTTIPRFLSEAVVRPETEFCEGRSVDSTTSPNRKTMSISLSKSPVSLRQKLRASSVHSIKWAHTQQLQLPQHNGGCWLRRQKLSHLGLQWELAQRFPSSVLEHRGLAQVSRSGGCSPCTPFPFSSLLIPPQHVSECHQVRG